MFSDPFPIGSAVPEPQYRNLHEPGDREAAAKGIVHLIESLKKALHTKDHKNIHKEIHSIENDANKLFHIVTGNKTFSHDEEQLGKKFQKAIEDLTENKNDPRLKNTIKIIHPYIKDALSTGREWLNKITS